MNIVFALFWSFLGYLLIVIIISWCRDKNFLQEKGSYATALAAFPFLFLVFNAVIQQKSVSSDIEFGKDFANLPNYLILSATLLNAFLLYKTLNIQNNFNSQQAESNSLSQFEQHYFQMLKYFRDLSEKEKDETARITAEVKNMFSVSIEGWNTYFENLINNDDDGIYSAYKEYFGNKELRLKIIKTHIKEIYRSLNIEKDFGHYFRSLYHLIKYVDEYPDKYGVINKGKYIDLIQAYMNDDELYLCFIGGLGYSDKKKNYYGNNFAIYAESYTFLENILSKGDFFLYQFRNFYPKNYEKWKSKGHRTEFGMDD